LFYQGGYNGDKEDSMRINEYYQPTPLKRHGREQKLREAKIELPHFYDKEDVEAYLDWEMKAKQLFSCHQVSEERKIPLATLIFRDMSYIGELP